MGGAFIAVPLRVHLTHATVQYIADASGVDLLHVKGPALDASLRPTTATADGDVVPAPRLSTDADVLVRPTHLDRFMAALADHGWSTITNFESGSVFEHAASLWHTHLGYVDVHRRFPGIGLDPELAFERLWRGRHSVSIAHRDCAVPSVEEQRLVMLLHSARGGGLANPDARLWLAATDAERERCLQLAGAFHAEVALAAATGRLDEYADDPSAGLWRILASGGVPNRVDEWIARFRAARGLGGRARVLAMSVFVNTDHLGMRLGRRPTRAEIAAEYGRRIGRLVRDGSAVLRGRLRRRP